MSENRNTLVQFLLRMVQDPALAAEFRSDSAAVMKRENLSEDDVSQLSAMMPSSPQVSVGTQITVPALTKGNFYIGNDNSTHIFAVSTADADVAVNNRQQALNHRIHMVSPGKNPEEWPNPTKLTFSPNGSGATTVHLKHMIGTAPDLQGTILSLIIDNITTAS